MKKVLSISLGSSSRDHKVKTKILGEEFIIERRGTDGDQKQAAELFQKLDGKYDAFGLGGIDLYIQAGSKRYTFRDARRLIENVTQTPVVDGSGLKDTLERRVVNYIDQNLEMNLKNKKVLLVSGVDRFGMAEAFENRGADMILGDLIFSLHLPLPLTSLKTLTLLAHIIAPIITKLPFSLLYPLGDKQNQEAQGKFQRFYEKADIIAGDFHFIKMYLPSRLQDKTILTNTVTEEDIFNLKSKNLKRLITSTPNLKGRSFGTNVMEAVLVALSKKRPQALTEDDYNKLLDKIGFEPRVINFY